MLPYPNPMLMGAALAGLNSDYLIVAGGGGGGTATTLAAQGGDGGQVIQGSAAYLAPGTFPVTVGAGGAHQAAGSGSPGSPGGNSTFNGQTATGGAGGIAGGSGGSTGQNAGVDSSISGTMQSYGYGADHSASYTEAYGCGGFEGSVPSGAGVAGQPGAVIIRYPGGQRATGGTVTSITVGGQPYTVHTFTANGTFQI